jgi:hypothetical protein
VAVSGVPPNGICDPKGGFEVSFVRSALCPGSAESMSRRLGMPVVGMLTSRESREFDAVSVPRSRLPAADAVLATWHPARAQVPIKIVVGASHVVPPPLLLLPLPPLLLALPPSFSKSSLSFREPAQPAKAMRR